MTILIERLTAALRRIVWLFLALIFSSACTKQTVIVEPPSESAYIGQWELIGFTRDSGSAVAIVPQDSVTFAIYPDGIFQGFIACDVYDGSLHFEADHSAEIDWIYYFDNGQCNRPPYWEQYFVAFNRMRSISVEGSILQISFGDSAGNLLYKKL